VQYIKNEVVDVYRASDPNNSTIYRRGDMAKGASTD
jgi:hypothetical protein